MDGEQGLVEVIHLGSDRPYIVALGKPLDLAGVGAQNPFLEQGLA
jgi:hypothetical protein